MIVNSVEINLKDKELNKQTISDVLNSMKLAIAECTMASENYVTFRIVTDSEELVKGIERFMLDEGYSTSLMSFKNYDPEDTAEWYLKIIWEPFMITPDYEDYLVNSGFKSKYLS